MNICLLKKFSNSLDRYFPKTDHNQLQRYIEERVCSAMKKLNSIGNTINARKVYLDINPEMDPNFEEISIHFDTSGPNYETASLKVPTEIVRRRSLTIVKDNVDCSSDLVRRLCFLDKLENEHIFCRRILCHEFGHLQDAQRKGFCYKPPKAELLPYVDVIWNVLLENRLARYGIAAIKKEDNRKDFYRKLKKLRVEPGPKDFECLWQKHDYDYGEIKERAQKYFDSCKTTRAHQP